MQNPSRTASVLKVLRSIIGISFFLIPIAYIFSRAFLLVTVYVAIVAWFLIKAMDKQLTLPKTVLNSSLFFILAALLLSIVFGSSIGEGLRGLNKWLRGYLIFWVSFDVLKDEAVEDKFKTAFLSAFLISTLDGIFQYSVGRDLLRKFVLGFVNGDIPRVTSSFGYFGMYASFLIMTFPIVFSRVFSKSKKIDWILLIEIVLLGFLNLYWTRARGAWVSFAGMALLFFIFSKNWKVCALVTLSLCLALFILPRDILLHHPKTSGIDQTIGHRAQLWNQAINIIKAKPVTGSGLNTYVQNIKKYNPNAAEQVENYYAHNGYLQYTAETGFVGLFALLWLLMRYFHLAYAKWTAGFLSFDSKMLILSIAGFLFYVFFDTIFHNLQPFLFFWILLGWSVSKIERSGEAIA